MAYYKKTRHNMYSCFSLMVRFDASVTQLYRRTDLSRLAAQEEKKIWLHQRSCFLFLYSVSRYVL